MNVAHLLYFNLFLIGDPLNVVFMTTMLLLAMGFDTEQATAGIRNSIKNN